MINWNWTVFESAKVALSYAQFEKESGIKWKDSNNIRERYDVGLLSCTLQYLERPFEILRKFSSKCKYIIIMRLPFVDSRDHVITKQTFPCGGEYQTSESSWPAWFFSKNLFMDEVNTIGSIVYQWQTPTEVLLFKGKKVVMEGCLIRINKK
jgi:putative methyltransferase (TIGR04325 family)